MRTGMTPINYAQWFPLRESPSGAFRKPGSFLDATSQDVPDSSLSLCVFAAIT